jgi:hypothetical protein
MATTSRPSPLHVAVVGGGLAGLSAATRLAALGLVPTVFDMGRSPGGRACSRLMPDQGLAFDHGCQFLAPRGAEFGAEVAGWAAAGAAAEWRGRLGDLDPASSSFTPRNGSETSDESGFCGVLGGAGPVYVGTPSIGAVPALLAAQLAQAGGSLVQGQRVRSRSISVLLHGCFWRRSQRSAQNRAMRGLQVSRLQWDGAGGGGWTLHGAPRAPPGAAAPPAAAAPLGTFAAVVLADALTAVPTSPGYAGLLESCGPEVAALARRMTAASHLPAFTLMLAFDAPLGAVPFDGASIRGADAGGAAAPAFAWVARDSAKPGRGGGGGPECWVAVTTPERSGALLQRWPLLAKGGTYNPQTAAYKEGVAAELLADFAALLRPLLAAAAGGGDGGLPEARFVHAQRWGRAFVDAPAAEAFLGAPGRRVAACGDFCGGGGSGGGGGAAGGAERAWLSGQRAAEAVGGWLRGA